MQKPRFIKGVGCGRVGKSDPVGRAGGRKEDGRGTGAMSHNVSRGGRATAGVADG